MLFSTELPEIYISSLFIIPNIAFFTGDLNGHSEDSWPEGDATRVGREIENLLTFLGLSQISEPTNFEPNKSPSCIDLIITEQPNLALDSGTGASLVPCWFHVVN